MNWQFWKTKTNHPPQVLSEKVLAVINSLDLFLLDSSKPNQTNFSIVHFEVTILDQMRTVNQLVSYFKTAIESNYTYIPRSIVFFIDSSGTWHFYIGLYRTSDVLDQNSLNLITPLYIDCLTRTNSARTK